MEIFMNTRNGRIEYCNGDVDIIPYGATTIKARPGIKAIFMPDSITKIEDDAFNDCTSLELVEFSSKLIDIGKRAFQNCYALKELTFPNTVRNIGDSSFSNCRELKKVNFLQGVESIGCEAFKNCGNLESIDLPSSINVIHMYAFASCSKLSHISFIGNVSLAMDAFIGTEYYNNSDNWDQESNWFKSLYICNHLIKVKSNDYGNFSVKVKEGTIGIADCAFTNIVQLISVSLPDGLLSIGNLAFAGCGLTSIEIPKSVIDLGAEAFRGCGNLDKIILPEKMRSMGLGAFQDCVNIEHIVLPNSITKICRNTFENCAKISILELPHSVSKIESGAFNGLANQTTIIIPDSVEVIERGAFQYSKKQIKQYNIIFKGTKKQWKTIVGDDPTLQYSNIKCTQSKFLFW